MNLFLILEYRKKKLHVQLCQFVVVGMSPIVVVALWVKRLWVGKFYCQSKAIGRFFLCAISRLMS